MVWRRVAFHFTKVINYSLFDFLFFFFFNDTATTEIYTLSLHDALPISEKEPPKELFNDLEKLGWEKTTAGLSPLEGRQETTYWKPGSGTFQGWAKEETRINLTQVVAILAKHGIEKVPKVRYTLEDLL